MSTTYGAEFYDVTMTEIDAPAMAPLEESPWLPLYREAAGWIPPNHDVVDLGCGTGRFLLELAERGHYGLLVGLDFSAATIGEARRCVGGWASLDQADLREWQPDPMRAGHTTYVCLEVLEHLDDDLDLVSRIPPGHQFVMSVPNYESESHLRTFTTARDLWARYSHLLTFRRWSLIRLDDRKAIHVLDTVRRVDAW